MHEYSLAKEIANIVQEKIQSVEASNALSGITIKAGILSGVFPDSLSFYLEMIFQDMGWTNAKISIESVPAKYACQCGYIYVTEQLLSGCPLCNRFERHLIEGDQCIIETIEFYAKNSHKLKQ